VAGANDVRHVERERRPHPLMLADPLPVDVHLGVIADRVERQLDRPPLPVARHAHHAPVTRRTFRPARRVRLRLPGARHGDRLPRTTGERKLPAAIQALHFSTRIQRHGLYFLRARQAQRASVSIALSSNVFPSSATRSESSTCTAATVCPVKVLPCTVAPSICASLTPTRFRTNVLPRSR